jgi:hypothetical protein
MMRSRAPTQPGHGTLPARPARSPRLDLIRVARCAKQNNNESWAQRTHVDCLAVASAGVIANSARKSSRTTVRGEWGPLVPNRNSKLVSSFSCSFVTPVTFLCTDDALAGGITCDPETSPLMVETF